jgi:hypothetical protein
MIRSCVLGMLGRVIFVVIGIGCILSTCWPDVIGRPHTHVCGRVGRLRFRLWQCKADIGHILFLRILYHIAYHGQKSDIISYPIGYITAKKKG